MPHLITSSACGTARWTTSRKCSRTGRANGAALAILSSIRGSRSIGLSLASQQQHRRFDQPLHFLDEGRGVIAVDHTVIAADRQVHDLALLEPLPAHSVR